jgi:hypothetical protein
MEDLQEYAIERLLAASPVVYDDGGHKSFLSPEKREAIAYYDEAITLSEKFGNQAGREWALACATAEQLVRSGARLFPAKTMGRLVSQANR